MSMGALIGLIAVLLLGVLPAWADEVPDAILDVVNRELAGVRVADPPVVVGRRSQIGPQLYRRVVDGVILIVTKDGIGSGVVVSPKGHILTNWHVVGKHEGVGVVARNQALLRGMQELKREHVVIARVLAVDAKRDLALVLTGQMPAGLRAIPLAEPNGVEVGQDVYSIGHPQGLLWSYAEGVVSQIRPDYEWTYQEGSRHQATVIQTQTPMHPGSSGGALFDGDGRVVGINYGGKHTSLSFAISIGEVHDWIQSLVRR